MTSSRHGSWSPPASRSGVLPGPIAVTGGGMSSGSCRSLPGSGRLGKCSCSVLGGVGIGSSVPTEDLAMDRRTYDRRQKEPYIGFTHANLYNDLFAPNPKMAWRASYRRARRAGTANMPAQWILQQYPTTDYPMEIGYVGSFRVIELI